MKRLDKLLSGENLLKSKRESSGLRLFSSTGDLRVKAKVWESDSPVMKAVFAPSGDGFACGFASGIVQVFPEQHEIRVEPAVAITAIAWSRKSDFVVFTTEGGDIWKWDFKALELLGEYPVPVTSVCISPDNAYVITGSDDGNIQVRGLERGLLIAETKDHPHTGSVSELGFLTPPPRSKGKTILYSTSWDGTIRVWNWKSLESATPSHIGTIQTATGPICSISYDPILCLFGVSGELGVQLISFKPDDFNYKVKPPAVENQSFFNTVQEASIQAFRSLFLVGNLDGTIMILNPTTKTLVDFVQGRHYARLTSISATNDSSQFLSTSVDGLLKVWPAQQVLDNNPDQKPASWDRKGSSKVTSAKDLVRKLMPAQEPQPTAQFTTAPIVCSASRTYHSSCVAIVGREDGKFSVSQTFVLSDKDEKDFEFHLDHFREGETPEGLPALGCVAVSPCLNFLVTTHKSTLQLWVYHPTKKGNKRPERFKSMTFSSPVSAVSFSADEKYIIVGTDGLSFTQHLTLTLEEVMDYSFKDESEQASCISACAFAPNGGFLAAATDSGFVKIWKCNHCEYDDLYSPCAVWSTTTLIPDTKHSDKPMEGATSLDFGIRDGHVFLAAGTTMGHVFVWKLSLKELKKHRFSTEIYFASINADKARTYVEGSKQPIQSMSFTPGGRGVLTTTTTEAKYWNFSHKLEKPAPLFNPLKEFVIVGQKIVNLAQNLEENKKPERALLEETVPWHTIPYDHTLTASFSFEKDYIFVSTHDDQHVLLIEPVSVLPILFWHEFTMKVPGSEDDEVSPVIWLAQRKGSINAIKRMVKDGTESMFYITNELEQVPYLFAVKCGDVALMKYTSDDHKLDYFKDSLSRDAVYFSVFSYTSARMLFQGSSWYTAVDTLGFPPLHYAILNGKEEVVNHILFEVIPKLSPKEQRLVFESYDAKKRNPMMLLIEKYPIFAKKIMDDFGSKIEPFESGSTENLMVLATYNAWLLCPYKGNKKSQQNTAMQLMVHHNRKDLTSHPLSVFLFEKKKWSGFIRRVFMLDFGLQLVIVIILALASIISNPKLELGEFDNNFTGVGWFAMRLVIVILALFHLVWQLFVPLRTLVLYRTLDVNYRIVSSCVIYVVLIFLILGTINTDASTSNVAVSMVNLFLMMNIISYLPLFPGIGPVVLGVMNTFVPILYWASFFLVVFIAFSVSITTVASGYSATDFSSILTTMNSLFLGMFGDGDVTEILESGDGLGIALYYIYLIVVPLILFNILTSMVTDGYTDVENDKEALWRLNRSKLIMELENSLPTFIKRRFYAESVEVRLEEFTQEQDADKQETENQIDRGLDAITETMKDQKRLLFETLDRQEAIERKHREAMERVEKQRQALLDRKLERERIKEEKERLRAQEEEARLRAQEEAAAAAAEGEAKEGEGHRPIST